MFEARFWNAKKLWGSIFYKTFGDIQQGRKSFIFEQIQIFWSNFKCLGYLGLSLATFTYLWLSLVVSGYLWLYLAISGFLRVSQAISGYLRLSRDILGSGYLGCLRLSQAILGYLRLSWAISGYLRLSQDISGYLGLSRAVYWSVLGFVRLCESQAVLACPLNIPWFSSIISGLFLDLLYKSEFFLNYPLMSID